MDYTNKEIIAINIIENNTPQLRLFTFEGLKGYIQFMDANEINWEYYNG